jgi:hypothetical protein
MQIADNIQSELTALDVAQLTMNEKKTKLRNFVLSTDDSGKRIEPSPFLRDFTTFNCLLSQWADTLMTLIEATGRTFELGGSLTPFGVEPNNRSVSSGSAKIDSDMTPMKWVFLIAVSVVSFLICYFMQASYVLAFIFISGVVVLAYFRQIADYIRKALNPSEEPSDLLNTLGTEISESISYMRNRYDQKRFQIKFQHSDPHIQNKHSPTEDKALWDRETQALELLPSEFLNRIDTISIKCNGVVFDCKKVLYSYWRRNNPQSPQMPSFQPRGNT